MKTDQPQTIRLADYTAPAYGIDHVHLVFDLTPTATRVLNTAVYYRMPDADADAPLRLDGEDLSLCDLTLDGHPLTEGTDYQKDDHSLTLTNLPERFELVVETEIDPLNNTQLSGLYQSNGVFCTQCEAEGFRRITYFQDRPDVMTAYTVTLRAPKDSCPVLLSNGNLVDQFEDEEDPTYHVAIWEDPFAKPSYLFALVAGDLAVSKDHFTTRSGRGVDLAIYVEHGNEGRTQWAMDSLKASMKWDEDRFDLEYDLDLYNIVAVSDFNMGAMENKSLNVFNTKYVLADAQSATDTDYAGIEAVIAHEYFHNWTGNRVTCRDWFQLSLKEGLTVFRDQEFSSDMRSRSVERINNVKALRAGQFPEDAGPLAHPVRPDHYIAIDNFYTATIYNKGAEVIRMMHTLIGEDAFQKGMKLYFERHDGQAVTCDDFAQAMADASGVDLGQFTLWYSQAGTPKITAEWAYDAAAKRFDLTLNQELKPTPGQPTKDPMHIPLAIALLDPKGQSAHEQVVSLTEKSQTLSFEGIEQAPVVSLNRDFSAPITLDAPYSEDDLAFLMAHDSDSFARWEATQTYASALLLKRVDALQKGQEAAKDAAFIQALHRIVSDDSLDADYRALCLMLPTETYLADQMAVIDVDAIHQARETMRLHIAQDLQAPLQDLYNRMASQEDTYSPDAQSSGKRALRNACLSYLSLVGASADVLAHYETANNMTDRMAALTTLAMSDDDHRAPVLAGFYDRFKDNALVVNKWLGVQAAAPLPDALDQVKNLMDHEAFSIKNPNKVMALIATFAHANPTNFHRLDGEGYHFLATRVIELDQMNPQIAAGLIRPFGRWRRFDPARQALMQEQLNRIIETPALSKDTFEMAKRTLEG